MAVEFTIYCDDCGGRIAASRLSARAARATAQLDCGAVTSGGVDRCKGCRIAHSALPAGASGLDCAHSVGTHR